MHAGLLRIVGEEQPRPVLIGTELDPDGLSAKLTKTSIKASARIELLQPETAARIRLEPGDLVIEHSSRGILLAQATGSSGCNYFTLTSVCASEAPPASNR